MNYKKRDDSIYGAARYLANTLGIQIEKNSQKWHQAAFSCKCQTSHAQQTHDK
jgi:hypothetical protein